jgi:hypothetical protein
MMVPEAVAEKWPKEWAVFADRCLPEGHGLRAEGPIRRGSEFLKLLDDPAHRRKHIIFMTHGALTNSLRDPLVRLALLRQATAHQRDRAKRRRAIARFAHPLLRESRFSDEVLVERLLSTPPAKWAGVWNGARPGDLIEDDPVPLSLLGAIREIDVSSLRRAVATIPLRESVHLRGRLTEARSLLADALNETWTAALGKLDERLPLLVLDEAHHVRNDTLLARLFDNEEAERDVEALQGPLGRMFDRMLFLTATPFQLGHDELLRVLGRFHGVRWGSKAMRAGFDEQLVELGRALDRAQAAALRFERAWSRIGPEAHEEVASLGSFDGSNDHSEAIHIALAIGKEARESLEAAEACLRPWAIRHLKSNKAERRRYRPGIGIVDDIDGDHGGVPVGGRATLPFLLAARAQAVASLESQPGQRSAQSYFAYGLASSFEAYADTRRNRLAQLDEINAENRKVEVSGPLKWYLDRIAAALPRETTEGWSDHPKISATVSRALELWRSGEKVLIFCFYVETGRAIRAHTSRALRDEIIAVGSKALGLSTESSDEVMVALDRISGRLLRPDARGYDQFRDRVRTLAAGLDDATAVRVAEVVVRFMRTPSFLVRFVDLSARPSPAMLLGALDHADGSGLTLGERIESFSEHVGRLVDEECDDLFSALLGVQTGGIGTEGTDAFDPSERARSRETRLPNVRLANGGVRQETRQRLMLTFNAPFFPEILVASSVMAEGVDLHLDCRHVIHHDLDWNPSTLEQRTGRVDRIGSKAERSRNPLIVYEPYLGGTHDEKLYRVVKDRERWFGVVMGERLDMGEAATEKRAERLPLPDALASALTLDLSVTAAS